MKLVDNIVAEIEDGTVSYIPPFPARSKSRGNIWEFIKKSQSNVLGVFTEGDYRRSYGRLRIFYKNIILCNTPDLIQETLQSQHEIFQQKTAQMEQALKPLLGDGLFISYGDLWKERRSVVAPIVHANKIGGFAPTMCKTIQEWGDAWSVRNEGDEIDVLFEMAELTAEVISRTVFGKNLGRQFTSSIVTGFKEYQASVNQMDLISLFGFPDWWPRLYRGRIRAPLKKVHSVVDHIIEHHEKHKSSNVDTEAMIVRLFEGKTENGKYLSRNAIRNEAIVIFMAGHETTANTLAWAWLNISQSPRVRKKLYDELKNVLGGRAPVYEDIYQLRYTRFIIEETLRLYPPVPLLARRAVTDGILRGEPFKKGDILVVSPWLLHRNPKVWSHPDIFFPERFDTEIMPKPNKYAYIPFAIGPRICPGLTFGLTEAILAIAGLAQRFELHLKQDHKVEAVCRLTLRPGEKLPMIVHKRT